MIKIENCEVVGWEHAIRGMRNPKNSWNRSDTETFPELIGYTPDGLGCYKGYLGDDDLDLATRLAKGGPVHAKYRRMITVYVDITAPLYWWKEFDTYKVGTVANSCSTMHKIHDKEFTLDDFSHEHLSPQSIQMLEDIIILLNQVRVFYNAKDDKQIDYCTVMTDECYAKYKKDLWWQMIQLLPSSYNQKRTVMLNYEVLVGIYKWRKNHKLDEWREFCEWIEVLPYSELITGEEKSPSVELAEVGEYAVKGIVSGLSVEEILKRADVRIYDDELSRTRTVISRSNKPLTDDEKSMIKRMWENQGNYMRIFFKEV